MTAAIIVRDDTNTARELTGIVVLDTDETPRDIVEIWVRDSNNVSRLVFDPTGAASFTATPSPAHVGGTSAGTGTATTSVTVVTPTGGTGPYTYAWAVIEYDGVEPTAVLPNLATTAFTQTSIGVGEQYHATFRCTVTDSLLATATCDVTCHWIDIS